MGRKRKASSGNRGRTKTGKIKCLNGTHRKKGKNGKIMCVR